VKGSWERSHPCLHSIAAKKSRQGCLCSQEIARNEMNLRGVGQIETLESRVVIWKQN
jgi:hypothetical protein